MKIFKLSYSPSSGVEVVSIVLAETRESAIIHIRENHEDEEMEVRCQQIYEPEEITPLPKEIFYTSKEQS